MCYMQPVTSALRYPPAHHAGAAGGGESSNRVGVRELRQNLSVYLERVKRGESLSVTERGQVVALLSPLTRVLSPVERLIAEGRATPAGRSIRELRPRRLEAPDARPSEQIIAELRDDRL